MRITCILSVLVYVLKGYQLFYFFEHLIILHDEFAFGMRHGERYEFLHFPGEDGALVVHFQVCPAVFKPLRIIGNDTYGLLFEVLAEGG